MESLFPNLEPECIHDLQNMLVMHCFPIDIDCDALHH